MSPFKQKLTMFKQASQDKIKPSVKVPAPERVIAPTKDAEGKPIPSWKLVVQQEHLDKLWEKKKKEVEQQNRILALPAWKRAKMARDGSLPKLDHPLDLKKKEVQNGKYPLDSGLISTISPAHLAAPCPPPPPPHA